MNVVVNGSRLPHEQIILIGFLLVEYSVETNLHPVFSIVYLTSSIVNRGGMVVGCWLLAIGC
jgi:hypothetical protein